MPEAVEVKLAIKIHPGRPSEGVRKRRAVALGNSRNWSCGAQRSAVDEYQTARNDIQSPWSLNRCVGAASTNSPPPAALDMIRGQGLRWGGSLQDFGSVPDDGGKPSGMPSTQRLRARKTATRCQIRTAVDGEWVICALQGLRREL